MDYAAARFNMVEGQIRTNKVTDPKVLAALQELPREQFVPKSLRGIAYVDEDVEIAAGRTLMEPLVLARLLQAAEVQPTDVVLDVGAGTGYAAAVLSRMATTVVALEADADLGGRAQALLSELGVDNVAVVQGALEAGYAKQGPYDVVFLGGAVSEIPQALTDQLAEGGRLVAVVAAPGANMGVAVLVTRVGGVVSQRVLFDASTGALPGFASKPKFVF